MLIVRGDAQTLPSELNKAAIGEVWFDPIFPKTDGVDVGTVVFSPNGRTVWHQHEHGQVAPDHVWLRVRVQGRRGPAAGARRRHGMDRAQRATLARRHLSHSDVAHHDHDRCD